MRFDAETAATEAAFGQAVDRQLARKPYAPVPANLPKRDRDTSEAVLVRMADVVPKAVSWIWPSRIPAGKLILICGDPGLGKSWLTLDAAARISRGAAWPDGGRAPLGDVILLSAEDALDDTIRPRLDALGADVTRIHAMTAIREEGGRRTPVLAKDIDNIEAAIERTKARLVVVDPVSAYLGDTDAHRDAEVRSVLAPLAAVADRTGAAIVGVMHLGKGTQRPALYRAIGSIAFVAAARLVLAVAPHPQDERRRLLAPVKSNICTAAPTLAYRLEDGRLLWDADPVSGIDTDALLGATAEERETQTDAEAVIRDMLDDPADWPVDARQATEAGRAHGISDRTMQRTARRLGIRISRIGFGRGGRWVWHRPGIADTPIGDTTPKHDDVSSMAPMRDPEHIDDISPIDDTKSVRTSMEPGGDLGDDGTAF